MQINLISDIDKITICEKEWNCLVSENETNTIFQTYPWFYSWWKIFGHQNKLFFISVHDADEILGFAPLMISSNSNGKGRILRFVSDEKADYCDIIVAKRKEEVLTKMFELIFSYSKEWDSILFRNIPEGSTTTEIVKGICKDYNYKMIMNYVCCPTLIIKDHEADAIKMSNKYSLRRKYNYFKKRGEISFHSVRTLDGLDDYLDVFFRQHIQRRSLTKDPSLFIYPDNKEFYRELMVNILQKGWLLFSVVKFNGSPIAFHYGFDYNSRVIWYKPSFDINYCKQSPGKVLLKYLFDYSIDNNKYEFDFTVGDEAFKRHYANKIRRNIQTRIYKKPAEYFFDISREYIKRVIKKE